MTKPTLSAIPTANARLKSSAVMLVCACGRRPLPRPSRGVARDGKPPPVENERHFVRSSPCDNISSALAAARTPPVRVPREIRDRFLTPRWPRHLPSSRVCAAAPPQSGIADPAVAAGGASSADAVAADPGRRRQGSSRRRPGDRRHRRRSAHAGDVLGGVSVLDKEELTHDVKPSLGDTLADLPGVSASSFGPSRLAADPARRSGRARAGPRRRHQQPRPVLLRSRPRGHHQPADRRADRGAARPSALLFGSSAIGGVVNVIDTRIPRTVPDGPSMPTLLLNYGSAANERSANARRRRAARRPFRRPRRRRLFQVRRPSRRRLSAVRRLARAGAGQPRSRRSARSPTSRTSCPTPPAASDDLAGGLAYVDGDLNIGCLVQPPRRQIWRPDPLLARSRRSRPKQPTIDAHQNRGDARVNVPIGGFFKLFEFRGGISKYHHDELDPEGRDRLALLLRTAASCAPTSSRPSAAAGAGRPASSISTRTRASAATRNICPTAASGTSACSRCSRWIRQAPVRSAARASNSRGSPQATIRIAELVEEAGADSIGRHIADQPQFHRRSRLGRRQLRIRCPAGAPGFRCRTASARPSIDELFAFGPARRQRAVPDRRSRPQRWKRATASSSASTARPGRSTSRAASITAASPTSSSRRRPARSRTACRSIEYRQGKADYYGFELESDVKFGKALGIDWGGELIDRRGSREDQGLRQCAARSRRSACSAA